MCLRLHEGGRVVEVSHKHRDEDEVLHTRSLYRFDEVAIALQVYTLRVVCAPAHGGFGRGDYYLDAATAKLDFRFTEF